jgi:hypothetical protein
VTALLPPFRADVWAELARVDVQVMADWAGEAA